MEQSQQSAPKDDASRPAPEKAKAIKVGIPKEIHPNERRVAATPATVQRLRKLGLEVLVQSGAGEGASVLDGAYQEAGAKVLPLASELWSEADLILKVRAPEALPDGVGHEIDLLSPQLRDLRSAEAAEHAESEEDAVSVRQPFGAPDGAPHCQVQRLRLIRHDRGHCQ